MTKIVSFVVALLVGALMSVGCSGSPTSPTATVPTAPVAVVPAGPVQIAIMKGIGFYPFNPQGPNGGPGAIFKKTTDDLEVKVQMRNVDSYSFSVVVYNEAFPVSVPKVILSETPFTFQGKSGGITVKYDSSRCVDSECYLVLVNKLDKAVDQYSDNIATIFGTPER